MSKAKAAAAKSKLAKAANKVVDKAQATAKAVSAKAVAKLPARPGRVPATKVADNTDKTEKTQKAEKMPAKATVATAASPAPTSAGHKGRVPLSAEDLKAKIGALAAATGQVKALRRSINKSFYEVGTILGEIQTRKLYEAKGYSSFESFVEREIDLGKQLSLRVVRIARTFLKEAAESAGLERVSVALSALDGEAETIGAGGSSPPPSSPPGRSAIPFHKQ